VGLDTEVAIARRQMPAEMTAFALDVRQPDSIDAAIDRMRRHWDQIDGLVYVSGVGERPTPVAAFSLEQWDLTHDINLRGAFLLTKACMPLMRASTGSMVFIASGLAQHVEAGFAAYGASKAGLIALAKVLAKELAPSIRVNVVAPGVVQTAFLGGGTGRNEATDVSLEQWFGAEEADRMRAAIPLKRVALPDDIVAPVLFLLGSGARFITGQTLHVNGGRFLP
jgi:NAD(P)-dependent dehydrogenase (short-subunit alcohol dehydrogenase family)